MADMNQTIKRGGKRDIFTLDGWMISKHCCSMFHTCAGDLLCTKVALVCVHVQMHVGVCESTTGTKYELPPLIHNEERLGKYRYMF